MAMKNKETGLYEAKYFHKLTNAIIIGEGKTKEKAYEDLRKKRKEFKAIQTDKYITSPGIEEFEGREPTLQEAIDGKITGKHKIFEEQRVFNVYTRPDLVQHINDQWRKDNPDE